MGTLTVRNIPDEDLAALRVAAAERGRSMEAEVRAMIHQAAPSNPNIRRLRAEDLPPLDPKVAARVAKVQAMVREAFGGEMPKGRVDAFLAQKRLEALEE